MKIHLIIWRQKDRKAEGKFKDYDLDGVSPDMSFLEMLDILNEKLIKTGDDPVEFDNDCREGICGSCGCVINGQAHGPELGTTTCQLYMRAFKDGSTIVIEPWRARPFEVVKDLCVDRASMDRIIQAGGYISVKTGKHAEGNSMLVSKPIADKSFENAACIGCGACVAACPNASASLFTAAKLAHLNVLPQGIVEKRERTLRMVHRMDLEGFGNCSNIGECAAACPASIPIESIAVMKRDYLMSV